MTEVTVGHDRSREESVLATLIGCTFLFYLVGALYPLGSALGWLLAAVALVRLVNRESAAPIPASAWIAWAAMLVMLVAVWVGLLDFGRPWTAVIKSSVGWAKGWALLALFPLAAVVLRIRTSVVAAALSRLAIQALFVTPVLVLGARLGLPEKLYTPPLVVLGGSTRHFFTVRLYSGDAGETRFWYFSPWAPAAALYACLALVIVLRDPDPRRRAWGFAGALTMVVLSGSRLGLVVMLVFGAAWLGLRWAKRPWPWFAGALAVLALVVLAEPMTSLARDVEERFTSARADSSRVRAVLARLAIQRWQEEAFWWGHGTVERGPWSAEFMPIGSHHTWFGLLYVKGLVGVLALAVALLALAVALWRRRRHPDAQTAAAVLLVLVLFTAGENLEILTYLYWPALLVLGNGLKVPVEYSEAVK